MEVYGPDGKMPTNVNFNQGLIDEYNSIKLEVPEGMDNETAMCIVIGCCFDKETFIKADPKYATAPLHSLDFNRNAMIADKLIGDNRPSPVAKVMVEGKKLAKQVFDAYRNNDKAPATAMLNNLIDYESRLAWKTFALSERNDSGKFSPEKILNIIVPDVIKKNKDLGLDYNNNRPTKTPGIRAASLYKQLVAGKASESTKIDLGKNFFNMSQAEKEKKTAEMLLNGYVSRMADVQSDERDKKTNNVCNDIANSIGKAYINKAHKKILEETEKYREHLANYTISDFDIILSKPDGMDKIREFYLDKIKETDIFKQIVGAKDRDQLFEALEESDSAVRKGLTPFKDVRLPDLSSDFNNNYAFKLGLAKSTLHTNFIEIIYSEKDLSADDVDKYGLNSLDPEALKKNSSIMDQIYNEMKNVSTRAPKQFTDFMKQLKLCKDKAKSFSELGRNICEKEAIEFCDLMESAAEKADIYLTKCNNDKPERIKKTQINRGLLTAIPKRTLSAARKARLEKREEVCGERYAVFNKYRDSAQDKVYRGEKYKDLVPRSKHGYSSDRTANLSITIFAMAESGKYTLDDLMDPEKFVKEKQQMFEEVTQRLVRGLPEDQEWVAKVLHEGRKASEKLVDEKARQIDFSKADISDKDYCKLLTFGFFQFDAYQEVFNCSKEILRHANADKTEEHPEFTKIEQYLKWTNDRLNPLGIIYDSYKQIEENAGDLMEDQINPEGNIRDLHTHASLVKHGEKMLFEGQKKDYNKPFHEWNDRKLSKELKNLKQTLMVGYNLMLKSLYNDPKTSHDLLGKLMDGTLLEPQTVNGKSIEGVTITIDKETSKSYIKGNALTNKEFREIAFFEQPTDKMLGQVINDINKAKESVLFGSNEYNNAENSMTELGKAYKTLNELPANASEEQRLQAYASVKEKSREAQQKIDRYFERKTSQNLMNGNADHKTQKRIDAMKRASGVIKKLEEEMKQRVEKLREEKVRQSREAYFGKVNDQIKTEKNFSLTAAKGAKDAFSVLDKLSKNTGKMSDKEIETAKQCIAAVVYNDILQHDTSKRELAREIKGSPEMYKTTLEKSLNSPVMKFMTENLTREALSNFISDPKKAIDNAIISTVAVNDKIIENGNAKRQPKLAEEKKTEIKVGK